MSKKGIETLVGLLVLLGLAGLVFLSLKAANLASFGTRDTYTVSARFDNIGGLKARSPVRSAGVTAGRRQRGVGRSEEVRPGPAFSRVLLWAALCVAAVLLQGCSTLGAKTPGAKLDPWENWNRKVFTFNEKLDEKVLKPVATTYSNLVPRPVRSGVDNFFGNAADAWSAINNFLQGKVSNGLHDVVRVGTNTV